VNVHSRRARALGQDRAPPGGAGRRGAVPLGGRMLRVGSAATTASAGSRGEPVDSIWFRHCSPNASELSNDSNSVFALEHELRHGGRTGRAAWRRSSAATRPRSRARAGFTPAAANPVRCRPGGARAVCSTGVRLRHWRPAPVSALCFGRCVLASACGRGGGELDLDSAFRRKVGNASTDSKSVLW